MRNSCLAAASVLLLATAVSAQPSANPQNPQNTQKPAAPLLDPDRNRLDALLLQWEQMMTRVETVSAECTRITDDKVSGRKEEFVGKAKYMKPNLAALYLEKKTKPDIFERYICSGTYLYEYRPQQKRMVIHELPPPKSGQFDDNLLSFLFGMKAEEAKRRYDLKLVQEDKWWIYLEIVPRYPADKADFAKARLVLSNRTFLPRALWFMENNKNEIKWDIPKIDTGVALDRKEFSPPSPPPGWDVRREKRPEVTPAPRVVRPQQ